MEQHGPILVGQLCCGWRGWVRVPFPRKLLAIEFPAATVPGLITSPVVAV